MQGSQRERQLDTAPVGRRKPVNLALQGGGAHGAFTWGVLDRLLEADRLRIDGVSGTSAGAVNAVALAAGLAEGGPDAARARLEAVWRAISQSAFPHHVQAYPFGLFPVHDQIDALNQFTFQRLTQVMSPYQFNPLDINPLRTVLNQQIDFERLQATQPVRLFIAATDVATGGARIFRNPELSVDVVLASACLPTLFKAIEIDGRHYWDGGFSANPDLTTLIGETRALDTLLVLLNPLHAEALPTRQAEIASGIDRITFNQPLRHEIALIDRARRARLAPPPLDRVIGRLRRSRFHLLEAGDLDYRSRLKPEWASLQRLFGHGRAAAERWLASDARNLGLRSSVDLHAAMVAHREDVA